MSFNSAKNNVTIFVSYLQRWRTSRIFDYNFIVYKLFRFHKKLDPAVYVYEPSAKKAVKLRPEQGSVLLYRRLLLLGPRTGIGCSHQVVCVVLATPPCRSPRTMTGGSCTPLPSRRLSQRRTLCSEDETSQRTTEETGVEEASDRNVAVTSTRLHPQPRSSITVSLSKHAKICDFYS